MSQISLVSVSGKKVGDKPIEVLAVRNNKQIIFDAVNCEFQNQRQGTHDTKNKSEVSGTGKKPYRQKHTGRARQGSRRNPHFRGGGIAFGPTPEKNYSIKVNKKVSRLAFLSVWGKIVDSSDVCVLDESFDSLGISTKSFANFLKSADISNKKILCIFSEEDKNLIRSSRNIGNIRIRTPDNCSVRDLLDQNYILISNKSFESFIKRTTTFPQK